MNISHAGDYEDIFIHEKFFPNKQNGFYIELGGLDGIYSSNTKIFEDYLNWTGILIEPHPNAFKKLEKNRPNNNLFNDLISSETKELQFKYMEGPWDGISGIVKTLPIMHDYCYFKNKKYAHLNQHIIYIKPKSLSDIVKSTNTKHIDFLSLDVEGHEFEVLQSWDFSIPIDLIMIEVLDDNNKCQNILKNNNYKYICNLNGYNDIYILKNSKLDQDYDFQNTTLNLSEKYPNIKKKYS
jgi:FkbM family methyltransferase